MTAARRNTSNPFPALLQHHWLERKRQNADFSLRKFATLLDLDPTALSRLMKGERKPTAETLHHICERLMISPAELAEMGITTGRRGRSTKRSQEGEGSDTTYHPLSQDTFEAMSNWYYFAILEAAYLDDFNPSPKWLAQRLGISEMEVKIALQTMQRLGLIQLQPDGSWTEKSQHMTNIEPEVTTPARRKLQKQLLERSIAALETVPLAKRDHTSMTFAVDSTTLAEARERIKEFRRDMNRLMQKSNTRDEIYQLTISLFPETQDTFK